MCAAVTASLQPQSYTQASSPEWSSCLPALIPLRASCLHLPALTGNRPPARGQWRPGKLTRLVPISWCRCLQNSLQDWRKGPCSTPQSGFSFFMAFIKFLWLLLSWLCVLTQRGLLFQRFLWSYWKVKFREKLNLGMSIARSNYVQ